MRENPVIQRTAEAIRGASRSQVYQHATLARYGEVKHVTPLVLDVGDDTVSEAAGNLTIGDAVRLRMDLQGNGLDTGDTVACLLMEDGDWHAFDVVSDAEMPSLSTGGGPGTGDKTYRFPSSGDNPAALTWMINHNLGKYPTPIFFDHTGVEIVPDTVSYPSTNLVIATFSVETAGHAFLN